MTIQNIFIVDPILTETQKKKSCPKSHRHCRRVWDTVLLLVWVCLSRLVSFITFTNLTLFTYIAMILVTKLLKSTIGEDNANVET